MTESTDTITSEMPSTNGNGHVGPRRHVSASTVARILNRNDHSANAFINRYSELMGYPHTGSGNPRRFDVADLPIFKALSDASKMMPFGFPNEWVPLIVDQLRETGRASIQYESDGVKLTINVELPGR